MTLPPIVIGNAASTAYQPAGLHLLADLHGVRAELLRSAAGLDALLRDGALVAGAHILHGHFHTFGDGGGVTGVLLLAESHISIHTWPEAGFAAIDIFMCGNAQPERALEAIQTVLMPQSCQIRAIDRA